MEWLLWLLAACITAAAVLGIAGICKRLRPDQLPETIVTVALLQDPAAVPRQLQALAAQYAWTDRDLVRAIWLADCTPDGALESVCVSFCRKHGGFHYFRLGESAKISGNPPEPEKKDCNLSKKQV